MATPADVTVGTIVRAGHDGRAKPLARAGRKSRAAKRRNQVVCVFQFLGGGAAATAMPAMTDRDR